MLSSDQKDVKIAYLEKALARRDAEYRKLELALVDAQITTGDLSLNEPKGQEG